MKQWLTRPCPLPRWLLLVLILLDAAAFVLPYAQTNMLFNETIGLRVELTKIRQGIGCIYYLDWPFWGALANYPRVLVGLACTLLVLLGLAGGLRRGRHSPPPDYRTPITDHQSPITDHRPVALVPESGPAAGKEE